MDRAHLAGIDKLDEALPEPTCAVLTGAAAVPSHSQISFLSHFFYCCAAQWIAGVFVSCSLASVFACLA